MSGELWGIFQIAYKVFSLYYVDVINLYLQTLRNKKIYGDLGIKFLRGWTNTCWIHWTLTRKAFVYYVDDGGVFSSENWGRGSGGHPQGTTTLQWPHCHLQFLHLKQEKKISRNPNAWGILERTMPQALQKLRSVFKQVNSNIFLGFNWFTVLFINAYIHMRHVCKINDKMLTQRI